MSALDDRNQWLAHLHNCMRCPVDLCDEGLELAAAVRDSMAPGEHWEGVFRPIEKLRLREPLVPFKDRPARPEAPR